MSGQDQPPEVPSRTKSTSSQRQSARRHNSAHTHETVYIRKPSLTDTAVDENRATDDVDDDDDDADGYLHPVEFLAGSPHDDEEDTIFIISSDSDLTLPPPNPESVEYKKQQSHVDKMLEIVVFPWYWGPLTTRDTEEQLEKAPAGTFLLRDSDNASNLCLTAKRQNGSLANFCMYNIMFNGCAYFSSSPEHSASRTKRGADHFASVIDLVAECVDRRLMSYPHNRPEHLCRSSVDGEQCQLAEQLASLTHQPWYWGPIGARTITTQLHQAQPGAAVLVDSTQLPDQVLAIYVMGKQRDVFRLSLVFEDGYFKVDYKFYRDSEMKWSRSIQELVLTKLASVVTPSGDCVKLTLLQRK